MKSLALLLSLVCASALAQDWQFNTANDTNGCAVNLGPYSEGWLPSLLGGNGLWDAGQLGNLTAQADVKAGTEQTLTVKVTSWLDDGIFPPPVVEVPSGVRISAAQTTNPVVGLGAFQTFTSTWTVTPATDKQAVVVKVTGLQKGLLVDRIEVSTSASLLNIAAISAVRLTWPAGRVLQHKAPGGDWQDLNSTGNLVVETSLPAGLYRIKP